ncbi:MAG: DMT family transporter [Gemmatimonadota bacterium]|nr:DMT family transporter [Gemmatimonadales bacterium]MDQ3137469.1 DMT family transporter [Gemmatimonadota bacterium]
MILFVLLAILGGAMLPVQTGVNLQLRGLLGHPLTAALVSFVVGSVGLAAAAAVVRAPVTLGGAWARSEWWHWSGGLLGAVYIAGTIVLAPRLGAATLVAALVAGQMIASLIVDQFGWVGFAEHPISPLRLLGAALVVGGVVLVRR